MDRVSSYPGLPGIEEISWEVILSMLKPRTSWENWDELVNLPVVRILGGEVKVVTAMNFLSWCPLISSLQ